VVNHVTRPRNRHEFGLRDLIAEALRMAAEIHHLVVGARDHRHGYVEPAVAMLELRHEGDHEHVVHARRADMLRTQDEVVGEFGLEPRSDGRRLEEFAVDARQQRRGDGRRDRVAHHVADHRDGGPGEERHVEAGGGVVIARHQHEAVHHAGVFEGQRQGHDRAEGMTEHRGLPDPEPVDRAAQEVGCAIGVQTRSRGRSE
jgi:hypothetical protein